MPTTQHELFSIKVSTELDFNIDSLTLQMRKLRQNIEELQSAILTADEEHKKEVSVLRCRTTFLCFEQSHYLSCFLMFRKLD
jgi:hypothetical protein